MSMAGAQSDHSATRRAGPVVKFPELLANPHNTGETQRFKSLEAFEAGPQPRPTNTEGQPLNPLTGTGV
jgi:hypothetical protein